MLDLLLCTGWQNSTNDWAWPHTAIWLVKKQGNLAVFPRSRSGRFEGHLIQPGDMYKVKGHCEGTNGGSPATTTQASTSAVQSPGASFGAYAIPTYTAPQPHSPVASWKKTWRKTIVLVSVRKSVKVKEKSGTVCYDVITQVVVLLSQLFVMSRKCPSLLLRRWILTLFCLIQRVILCWTMRVQVESPSGSLQEKSLQQIGNCIQSRLARTQRASIDLTKDDSSDDWHFATSSQAAQVYMWWFIDVDCCWQDWRYL